MKQTITLSAPRSSASQQLRTVASKLTSVITSDRACLAITAAGAATAFFAAVSERAICRRHAPLVHDRTKKGRRCEMNADQLNEYYDEIQDIIAEGVEDGASVVAMFLKDYLPELPPKETPHNMTSTDIAMALEDVCALKTTVIAAVMVRLGYSLFRDQVRGFVWSMRSDVTPPYANG